MPRPRSLRALDALTFFLADVQDGLGPYLAIYLTTYQHWAPSEVGVAMAAVVVGTLIAQMPAGALIDRTTHKPLAVTSAAAVVGASCIAMIAAPVFAVIVAAQALIGAAAAVMPPGIAGISLGLVGRAQLGRRTGRNEAFNHAGNVTAAVLAGAVGTWLGYGAIFVLVAIMAAASAVSVLLIRPADIDDRRAREEASDGEREEEPRRPLFTATMLAFYVSVFLFHFANAAMLPLVGQKVSAGQPDSAAALMSACIIAAQLVMVPVALVAARSADRWGRKAVFLVGFAVLPIRGLLYTYSTNSVFLVAVQLLDGIGAGIYGVVGVLVIADLARGSGRFNFALGAMAVAAGLGAASSNVVTGLVADYGGYDAGFVFLASVAIVGLAWFAIAVGEPSKSIPATGAPNREAPLVSPGVAR